MILVFIFYNNSCATQSRDSATTGSHKQKDTIVVMMYMTATDKPARIPAVPAVAGAALIVSAILIFYLGILPTRVLELAAASISTIF